MKVTSSFPRRNSGFTLLELLIVITIIGIMSAILVVGVGKAQTIAVAAKNTANLRDITMATLSWAQDNGGKLPSPQYPGGMTVPSGMSNDEFFPENYNLANNGLWIDGVVFASLYIDEGTVNKSQVDGAGNHLKGTVFENTQSVKQSPMETDWHKHSYAMNANLQYDRVYDSLAASSDPYLTEKTLANMPFLPNAMLYIENRDSNIVRHQDRAAILETSEQRWDGGKIITTFLDGHAERLHQKEIPEGDPESVRESSRFWRGVDP